VKVKDVLEALNNMPLEDDLVIKWYSKKDIEILSGYQVARESWEDVVEKASDNVSMGDFCIPYLLEQAINNENLEKSI